LILGAAGSGKTILLIDLARELLDRAQQDDAEPIPAIFLLSTWTDKKQPIAEWLAAELLIRYFIPLDISKSWINSGRVIALLDGLDEVAKPHREACLTAINTYVQAPGKCALVVCCRSADYFALHTRLLLHEAVEVKPLTEQQIDTYLSSAGEHLVSVRTALHADPELRDLARTPFFLSVMTFAYNNMPVERILTTKSNKTRREQLFEAYVQRALERRGTHRVYTPELTKRWLRYLARQMASHDLTEFHIERIQADWLSEDKRRFRYYLGVSIIIGLMFGVPSALYQARIDPLPKALFTGVLAAGIAMFLLWASDALEKIRPAEVVTWFWSWSETKAAIRNWAKEIAEQPTLGDRLGALLFTGILLLSGIVPLAWLGIQLTSSTSSGMLNEKDLLIPNEGIWRSARNSVLIFILSGFLFGSSVGFVAWAFDVRRPEFVALFLGLIFGSFSGLRAGGLACIQHALLRLHLVRAGHAPIRYARFLDYCAELILLRKVGGGYMFIHLLLQDYLAAKD
jgi:hypothetical protein